MTEDRALVSRIISGDMEAFSQLIKKHERLVVHMIGRVVRNTEDREEICQDVFLKVLDKLPAFNYKSRLSTWIATIAYRQAINHARKKRLQVDELTESENFRERFISQENLEAAIGDMDMEEKVKLYIEQLPVHYRTILTLYHLDGMNYTEIGEVTGMPEGTVKNYLFRARNLLKEKLIKQFGKEIE